MNKLKSTLALSLFLLLNSCSIYEAVHAPSPVEYKQIQIGGQRDQAISLLGFPKLTKQKAEHEVDTFEFIDDYNTASKSRVILYFAGDFFTLGLAEFIFWPMESNLLDGEQCIGNVTYDANERIVDFDFKNKKNESLWSSSLGRSYKSANNQDTHVIISNKFNMLATKLDYEKTLARCKYESSKAELGGVVPNYQDKAVMTGSSDDAFLSLSSTLGQMSANATNEKNAKEQKDKRQNAILNLYQQCIDADGFKSENVSDKDLTAEMKQKCPDLSNSVAPCLMLK